MTTTNSRAVFDRMEADEAFAERVKDAGTTDGAEAALAILRAEGFEVTQEEMRDAFLDRYGDQLTPEQLEAVAAGADRDILGEAIAGGAALVFLAAGFAAAV